MKELEVNKVLPVINANFEEVKESLNQSLEKYKGIVVTEENLQDCKKIQQDIGKIEKGIEDLRKSVKKDMEAPIKEFDAKCKALTALTDEVKKPIKEGIVLYDTKRKEEKKKQAEEVIKECIISLALSEKYSRQLTVLDKYTNLSASKKSVVEDVQVRGQALKQQQDSEEKEIENTKASINAFVDSINEDINSKLEADDYYKYIPGSNITRIMEIIKREYDKVKLAENPPKVEVKEEVKQESVQEKVSGPVDSEIQKTVPVNQEEKLYFYDIRIVANLDNMLRLQGLIKSEGFTFEVKNKGVVDK